MTFNYKQKVREYRQTLHQQIAEYVVENPTILLREIAKLYHVSEPTLLAILASLKVLRGRGNHRAVPPQMRNKD